MQIQARPGKMGKLVTVVIAPIPGSPAFRAGLRPGDLIVRVDGKSTEGLNTPQVAEMLKGPKGTVVHVTAAREGSDESLEFTIVRDEISKASVDDAFLLKLGVGYIRIINFDETTNEELTSALKKLDDSNLQDHDRALVMGEPSFGKGLVQTVYPLSERTGLALTTARYYTPSGRLIQRDYANVSLYDYYWHLQNAPMPHSEVRLTDGGREVYGGGGIARDLQGSGPKLSGGQDRLYLRDAVFQLRKNEL